MDSSSTTASSLSSTWNNPHVVETPLPFVDKALNVAGSHVHHHLRFLRNLCDKAGKRPTDPAYNPRSLRVVAADWKQVTKKDMTDAVQQWWDLKAQYFDTVLLFKTGKFYELYHMDADVGVRVCGE